MESIDVDDDVFAVLKANAEPFRDPPDTPNAVLRRLLVKEDEPSPESPPPIESSVSRAGFVTPPLRKKRAPLHTLLPEGCYWDPILEALDEQGGAAHASDVIEAVGEKLEPDLKNDDFGKLESGKVRWENRVQFARLRMKEAGLLRADSKRGIWEISDAGRERLAASKKAA